MLRSPVTVNKEDASLFTAITVVDPSCSVRFPTIVNSPGEVPGAIVEPLCIIEFPVIDPVHCRTVPEAATTGDAKDPVTLRIPSERVTPPVKVLSPDKIHLESPIFV